MSSGPHTSGTPGAPHDAAVHVRGYLTVFGALLVLTALTVGVSYLDLPPAETVVVAVVIAAVKATLVAMFFMHLKSERPTIYWPLGLTAVLFVALFAFVLWTEADHLFGTKWITPFE
jgi:cytochrome c oxidase subunit 4